MAAVISQLLSTIEFILLDDEHWTFNKTKISYQLLFADYNRARCKRPYVLSAK